MCLQMRIAVLQMHCVDLPICQMYRKLLQTRNHLLIELRSAHLRSVQINCINKVQSTVLSTKFVQGKVSCHGLKLLYICVSVWKRFLSRSYTNFNRIENCMMIISLLLGALNVHLSMQIRKMKGGKKDIKGQCVHT